MAEADTFTFACNANESQHSSINVAVSASEQLDQPSRQDLTRSTTSMSMEPDRAGTAHAALLRRRGRFAIVVPSLKSKGDYVEVPEEYFVKEVVRQSGGSNGVTLYQVRLGNEQEVTIPHSRLLTRQNACTALSRFRGSPSTHLTKANDSLSERLNSPLKDSDAMSLSHERQRRAKRGPTPGFVDSSKLQLSSDEDEHGNAIHYVRPTIHLRVNGSERPARRQLRDRESLDLGSDDGADSSGVSVSRRPANGRSARTTRSMGSGSHLHLSFRKKGLGQDRGSDSEGSVPYVFSEFPQASTSDKGGLKKRKRDRSDENDSPAPAARRSGRIGRQMQSMRERREDEIYADDEQAPTAVSRAVGASESFKELPKKSEFRLVHSQSCDACGEYGTGSAKGLLVFCQGCITAYHRSCLGPRGTREHLVTKIADDDCVLQCRYCVGMSTKKDPLAPRHDICQVCKEKGPACAALRERKTARQEEKEREENEGQDPITKVDPVFINNVQHVLFRCHNCRRAYHFSHLPPRENAIIRIGDETDIRDVRFMQYCKDWACLDCVNVPGKVQGLVAWRPTDLNTYVPGYAADMVHEDEKEYLVKWEKRSYFQASWMPGAWVWGVTATAMRKAFAKRDNGNNAPKMSAEDAIPEEYLRIDIVLDVKYYTNTVTFRTEEIDRVRINEVDTALVKYKGLGYEEVVWEKVPKPEDEERWADFVTAYNDWVLGKYVHLPKQHYLKERLEKVRSMDFQNKVLRKKQPDTLSGGKLMDYQMEGLNWLLYKWYKCQNAILADEMGLGKTIQAIGFLATLVQDHKCWPFLVVVPNSTCPNWRREIKQWAPSLRVVAYYGSAESRKLAMQHELYPQGNKDLKCHIVVTSYEVPVDENGRRFLNSVPWAGLIVDEGQRLKNDKNLLYGALGSLKIPFRLLLTGTPLQNNARELFNLLQFLDKNIDAGMLEEEYSDLTADKVAQLHELIRPFFLRRTKAQVLTFLPPVAQMILPVSMTVLQKKLYKSILAKNPELIKSIFNKEKGQLKQAERSNLNNILMQLRKCLCHPFVYSKLIEERSASAAVSHRSLVEASSKLQLLELMLPQLQERGHRVLIFSQFLEMLDIVEDFLDGLELPFQRLDGSIGSLQKQKRIDAFNAPGSPFFAFLLSTRAGGVGINLATADTVIIMDPDFNPHQDIQALSRAHRIGQKKKVLVFQLMTRDSAEEKIIQIGRKKLALDHILIDKMDAEEDAELDVQSILKHGAAALFDDDNERDIHYDAASVAKLLDRSQAENTKTGEDNSAESQFSFARVWANDRDDLQDSLNVSDAETRTPDPTIWDKLLKERERHAAKQRAAMQETLGRGKRKRQVVNYAKENVEPGDRNSMSPTAQMPQETGSDTDFRERPAEDDEEETEEDLSGEVSDPALLRDALDRSGRGVRRAGSRRSDKQAPTFERAKTNHLAARSNVASPATAPGGSTNNEAKPCMACTKMHPVGHCPLKLAGVEHCPLCGIAHYGSGPTCPHLKSETQVRAMVAAIKESPEDKSLKNAAMVYLRGVKGHLVRKKKQRAQKLQQEEAVAAAAAGGTVVSTTPSMDVLQINRVFPDYEPLPYGPVPPPPAITTTPTNTGPLPTEFPYTGRAAASNIMADQWKRQFSSNTTTTISVKR